MEDTRHLILINGQDKTDSVASYRFQDGICEVVFTGSPKPYHYRGGKVQVLAVQRRIDLAGQIIVAAVWQFPLLVPKKAESLNLVFSTVTMCIFLIFFLQKRCPIRMPSR